MCLVLYYDMKRSSQCSKKEIGSWMLVPLKIYIYQINIYIYYKYIKQLKYGDSLGHDEKSCKTSLWFSVVTRAE